MESEERKFLGQLERLVQNMPKEFAELAQDATLLIQTLHQQREQDEGADEEAGAREQS